MEQKLEKYVYFDVELTDSSVISYYKQAHYLQKLENKLLGDFNKDGKYSISEPVLKELVSLHKTVDKIDNDKIYASAKVNKFKFNFVVEMGDIDHETKFASLKINEEFSFLAGDKKTIITLPVVYYKDANNQYFKEKIYKLFNLFEKQEDEGKEFDNSELAKLIIKSLSVSDSVYKSFIKKSRAKDKLYVENMLKIFERSGKFGSFALRRYNALLKEYASVLNPKNENYYHLLKQIIDKIMMEEEKSVSKEVALLIQKLRTKYVKSVDNLIEVVIKNPPKKVEEKPIVLKGDGGTVHVGKAYVAPKSKKAVAKKSSLIEDRSNVKKLPSIKLDLDFGNDDVKQAKVSQPEVAVEEWDMDIKNYIQQIDTINEKVNMNTVKVEIEALQTQTDIIMGPHRAPANTTNVINKENSEQTLDFS